MKCDEIVGKRDRGEGDLRGPTNDTSALRLHKGGSAL